jgi:single-stranded DNA-binding protein
MIFITATGYVTGDPKIQDGDYGKNITVSVRCKCKNTKQPAQYVNAVFYGKTIEVIQKYVEDGRQVTVAGAVKSIVPKEKKDGTKYSSIYLQGYEITLPENSTQSGSQPMSGNQNNSDDNDF